MQVLHVCIHQHQHYNHLHCNDQQVGVGDTLSDIWFNSMFEFCRKIIQFKIWFNIAYPNSIQTIIQLKINSADSKRPVPSSSLSASPTLTPPHDRHHHHVQHQHNNCQGARWLIKATLVWVDQCQLHCTLCPERPLRWRLCRMWILWKIVAKC